MTSLTKELLDIQRHSLGHASKNDMSLSHTSTMVNDALQITDTMANLLDIGKRATQGLIPTSLDKDYLKMSQEYKIMEGYRIHPEKAESETRSETKYGVLSM